MQRIHYIACIIDTGVRQERNRETEMNTQSKQHAYLTQVSVKRETHRGFNMQSIHRERETEREREREREREIACTFDTGVCQKREREINIQSI